MEPEFIELDASEVTPGMILRRFEFIERALAISVKSIKPGMVEITVLAGDRIITSERVADWPLKAIVGDEN